MSYKRHDIINIATWNATGIMSSASYLHSLLDNNQIHICGISEHWLYKHDLLFLESINNSYKSHAVSDPDLLTPSNRRVGKGDLALL